MEEAIDEMMDVQLAKLDRLEYLWKNGLPLDVSIYGLHVIRLITDTVPRHPMTAMTSALCRHIRLAISVLM